MTISAKAWKNYITILRKVSDRATKEMEAFIRTQSARFDEGIITRDEFDALVIDYAYALATRYGEAAGAAACDMYDAISELQGAVVPPAVMAPTATKSEVAKAVNGTMKTGNMKIVADAVGRQVKIVGVDTMLKNAERDGDEFAWIPQGDTCAFCITLASRGWQKASKITLKNGHAEHVHANCDCTYAVRHTNTKVTLDVEGYDPQEYQDLYYDAPLRDGEAATPKNRINAMRRQFYAENGTEELNVN